jgi:N6-adenosine-specific RNA methylase IME4
MLQAAHKKGWFCHKLQVALLCNTDESVLDELHLSAELWCCATHMTVVTCFQKCGFNINQTLAYPVMTEVS